MYQLSEQVNLLAELVSHYVPSSPSRLTGLLIWHNLYQLSDQASGLACLPS
jgi:hypothetical protein